MENFSNIVGLRQKLNKSAPVKSLTRSAVKFEDLSENILIIGEEL
jgi:hypothetical protein